MDARPQRLRVFRAAGDENVAPLPSTKQTIHQRHKSTGTLSSMLNTGGLRAAAKRTVFGDVSNTRNTQNVQDDSALPKQKPSEFIKPQLPIERSAALLRPAQRPLNPAGAKQAFPAQVNAIVEPVAVPLARSSIADLRQAPLPFNRQPVAKRAPAVYKDVEEVVVVEEVSRPLTAPAPKSFDIQSQITFNDNNLEEERGGVSVVDDYIKAVELPLAASYEEQYVDALDIIEKEPVHDVHDELPEINIPAEAAAAISAISRSLPLPPIQSDPAEPHYEEGESDEDFATAYSFRSRGGDNTTGGATMIMAPHVTNRARQELAEARLIVEGAKTQEDIEDEAWDTSMVAEYGDEIFSYMRELESKMLPNPHYMDNQAEIQWSMRSVLMDWLVQVHHRFALLPETLFLCVNYIDRFLSCKVVSLGKLQLVGATAIFVAAKYEEINCPSVQEIAYMVDGGYTTDEILKAERYMLSMLQFELGWPGPMSFLRRISKADEYDLETRTLAKYFLEVTIMDERFVGSVPSYIAAGAHALARFMLKKGDWTAHHAYYSGYTWTQLRPLVSMILECCRNPQKHHCAVFEKYADRRYKRASIFVQDQMEAGFLLPQLQPAYIRPSLLTYPEFMDNRFSYEAQESRKHMSYLKA